jgi:diguanylate cyclase (GGDEF)-like protein
VSKTDYFACRYGGDEFVVVCETSQDFKPKDFLEEVNALLSENARKAGKEYTMKFSVGYKKYSPEYTDVSSFIAAADEGLYMIKNSRPKIKDMI